MDPDSLKDVINYDDSGMAYVVVGNNDGSVEERPEDSPIIDYTNEEETVYKKTVRWLLLMGTLLVPLFFLPWTSSILELNKQLVLVVVAGVGLILWLLDVVMSGKLSWRHNSLDKGLIAFLAAVVLSAIFSVSKFKSIFGSAGGLSDSLLVVTTLTVIYLLIVNSFHDNGKAVKLFFSISLIAVLTYGLLQLFGVYIFSIFRNFDISIFNFTESRSFNTLGSINVLGIMAAVGLPILYRQNILVFKHFDISRFGILAALAVIVIVNWWVLWVVTITGMVAAVVFENISREAGSKFRLARFVFPMTVIVLGVFLVIVNFNLVYIKSKLPTEVALSQKLSFEAAKDVLKEKPAFGYGPENFSLAFDKYGAGELRNSTLLGAKFFDSTSTVFNIAVHNGAVGLAGLGFVAFILAQLLAGILRPKSGFDPENVGVVSSLVAVLVAMFFYPFNLVMVFVLYLMLALFALALWGGHRKIYYIEDKASLSMISSLGFIGGLIVALVGLYFVSTNYMGDIKYAEALNNKDTKKALNQAVAAINWNSNDDMFYRLASQLSLNALSEELNAKSAKSDTQKNTRIQNYLSSAVAFARRATEVSPMESNNWVNLGSVYQNLIQLVEGSDSLAEKSYLKASELRPGDPTFHNRIGSMYLFKSELLRQLAANGSSPQQFSQQSSAALLKAEDAFKKALKLSSSYGLAIYNLGIVYDRQGKTSEAVKQLEKIAPFNSDQPGLAFELGLLYYRANRKDKALEQLERAVVLSPDYANARWYLALIYEERREIERATEQLEAILSIAANKSNQTVAQKLEALRAGKVSTPARVLEQKPL